jgi:hypothetical protein
VSANGQWYYNTKQLTVNSDLDLVVDVVGWAETVVRIHVNGKSILPATSMALFLHLYQEITNQGAASGMVPYPLKNNSILIWILLLKSSGGLKRWSASMGKSSFPATSIALFLHLS